MEYKINIKEIAKLVTNAKGETLWEKELLTPILEQIEQGKIGYGFTRINEHIYFYLNVGE